MDERAATSGHLMLITPERVFYAGLLGRPRERCPGAFHIYVALRGGLWLSTADGGSVTWRPLTKDGAPVPSRECVNKPAELIIAVGETYDFEYDAQDVRKTLWLEIKTPAGKWQAQAHVVIK